MHAWHVFGRGTSRFVIVLSVVFFTTLLGASRVHASRVERVLFMDAFVFDFALESFMMMKVCTLALMTYVAMKLFVMTPYDIALVQRVHYAKIYVSKLLLLSISAIAFTSMWWVWTQIIGMVVHGQVHGVVGVDAWGALLRMMVVYTALFGVVGVRFKHLMALLLVWVVFWLTEMTVDFGSSRQALSHTALLVNALVANAHVFTVEDVGVVWPIRMQAFVGLVYVITALSIYRRQAY